MDLQNSPMNIWLIREDEFDKFTFTGGKVVYIVEEPDPRFISHPAIITAGALLPPIEAIQAELDGRMFESVAMYEQYLQSELADPYISILIAAAFKNIPIGIMFGKDELNLQFPKMFIDFVYKYYGLVLGIEGKVQPYVTNECIPLDLAKLYNMNVIDYQSFMEIHPDLPIDVSAISKLAYDNNPIVASKTFEEYVKYFNIVNKVIKREGRFLIDPMVSI